MQTRALILAFTLCASLAVAETLPAGVVACMSQKDAQAYAKYQTSAPTFAADMLARATCYTNKDSAEVVPMGKSGAFEQYKLLSGHKVWVAKDTVHPTKTPNKPN
ncbi:MAG: hypothetical protein WAZ18_04135 [Alphaproteobacteria bacterium]